MTPRTAGYGTTHASLTARGAHPGPWVPTLPLALLGLVAGWLPAQRASAGCETVIEVPTDPPYVNAFGQSVSVEGNLAVIGADETDLDVLWAAGSAFVFEHDGAAWVRTATLGASDPTTDVHFGSSVDSDGDVIAVGADYRDSGGLLRSGAVYVFRRQGMSWVEEAILTAPNPVAEDHLGASVAISGNTIVAGAPSWSSHAQSTGWIHVFEYDGANWTHQAQLRASDTVVHDRFGADVALDGDRIIAGAPDHSVGYFESGAAYIFQRDADGWAEEAKLTAAALTHEADFGRSVSLQGTIAVVGEPAYNSTPPSGGAVYVFRNEMSGWAPDRTLHPPEPLNLGYFGGHVALDGMTLVVSDSYADNPFGPHDGAVYLYDLVSADTSPVTPLFPDRTSYYFGSHVDVSGDWAIIANASSIGYPVHLFPIFEPSEDCDGNGINDACDLDCDFNGVADVCDIADGNVEDCDADSIPDGCALATGAAPDCNGNAIPDACDIDSGTSRDCDVDSTPDECQPVVDCNANAVLDACDAADGTSDDCNFDLIPDECQPVEDCDNNGITDICDIGSGTEVDCNHNLRPDSCELSDGTAADGNANGVLDECDGRPLPDAQYEIYGTVRTCETDADCAYFPGAQIEAQCIPPSPDFGQPGTCYVQRNRYISINPNPTLAGEQTARRVSLLLDGGATAVLGWVGEPIALDGGGPEAWPKLLSRIESEPHYRDWAVDNLGTPWPQETVHVGDCEIVPGQTYHIQSISVLADPMDEVYYSTPLELKTVPNWGDVAGYTGPDPPQGDINFKDISMVVSGFLSGQALSKVWLDLAGGASAPEIPDFTDISFTDIAACVFGFQGGAYPYAAPLDCPDQIDP